MGYDMAGRDHDSVIATAFEGGFLWAFVDAMVSLTVDEAPGRKAKIPPTGMSVGQCFMKHGMSAACIVSNLDYLTSMHIASTGPGLASAPIFRKKQRPPLRGPA